MVYTNFVELLCNFCRAFDGTSFKRKFNIPLFFQVEIYAEQKSLPTFSVWSEVTLKCTLFILSIRKTVRKSKKKFDHTVFVELFTAHLLGGKSRFYHLLKPRYMPNKKCYNMEKFGKKKKCHFFFQYTFYTLNCIWCSM